MCCLAQVPDLVPWTAGCHFVVVGPHCWRALPRLVSWPATAPPQPPFPWVPPFKLVVSCHGSTNQFKSPVPRADCLLLALSF